MRPWSTTLALTLAACSPPSTTQEEGKASPRAVAPTPEPAACEEPSSGAPESWVSFDGGACGFELRSDGDALVLRERTREPSSSPRGEPPSPCLERNCVYEGAWSEAGPLVLAIVPSLESEMPQSVWLGIAGDDRLWFVDLWEGGGEPVIADHTRMGPAHALAPFVCGERLALLAEPRLPAGEGLPPPDELRAREGLRDPGDPQAAPEAVSREGCRPVALPLP